jgi:predicted O-methyltransferase YrrM
MLKVKLNCDTVSRALWEQIFCNASHIIDDATESLRQQAVEQERLRRNADLNTGSIGLSSAMALFLVTRAQTPGVVIEVGTFIGRSTRAMALAMSQCELPSSTIYTCDYSNNLEIPSEEKVTIEQFKQTSSTEMFQTLIARDVKADLVFLDGRLGDTDAKLLASLVKANTIYLLDDFEGIEKGVCNSLKLETFLSRSHFLVYPPQQDLLSRYRFSERCTMGAWIPISSIGLSRQ